MNNMIKLVIKILSKVQLCINNETKWLLSSLIIDLPTFLHTHTRPESKPGRFSLLAPTCCSPN